MTCIISTSNEPDCMWACNNKLFTWFTGLVTARFHTDDEILKQMEIANAVQGISLDSLFEENQELTLNVAHAIRTLANEVANNEHSIPKYLHDASLEGLEKCRSHFAQLVGFLDQWRTSLS